MPTDLLLTMAYLAQELQHPPFGCTSLGTPPGFLEKILPHQMVLDALKPGKGKPGHSSSVLGQLLGLRVTEYEMLPEWGLVWLQGTEMVGTIDLRRAIPKPVDRTGLNRG